MNEILEILSENAKATPAEIAALLGRPEAAVASEIQELEDSGVIRKYITLINWEKLDKSYVFAVLELKVALQRKTGYDAVAEKIAPLEGVQSTCTHFILKSYKEHGVFLTDKPKPQRLVITP